MMAASSFAGASMRDSLVITLLTSSFALGGDIGFIEDFALGKDRAAALAQLIPGTEDYYYYHALHALNSGKLEQATIHFPEWYKRFGQSARLTEIQTRYALLNYENDPKKSLDYLRNHFNIQFHHQREIAGATSNYANRFDAKAITRDTLKGRAFGHNNLSQFEDRALEWLAAEALNHQYRRELLSRLARPDLPNLVQLIIDDLDAPNSSGFGSMPIHSRLTRAQLDDLEKKKPALLGQTAFVHVCITKLYPGADDDWRHDPEKTSAFLDRLLAFTRRLTPAFNSLKTHVLYHKLVFDRSHGRFDKNLFLEYLKLPRQQGYMARRALESEEARRWPVDLNAVFNTQMPPIGSDEQLVRSYLKNFFAAADSYKEFEPFINDVYLKHLFAETKIELGLGEPEKWASELPPELFARLKERIDIDFSPANKTSFAVDEPVQLELHVKNVSNLFVKVYEINTFNYYRDFKKEVDTDINLDGLVPNFEMPFQYADPPQRRVSRKFDFPQLNKAGVYVVDFIGSGKSSRALVRKGRLRPLANLGTAGQVISVVDERNRPVPDASAWLGGTEYKPENGTVIIPFSTAPARQPIILRKGDFACLDWLDHQGENYRLVAGIHIDREQLLAQRLAKVLVRPSLMINGQPVSTKLLENVKLRIVGVDSDGIQTASEVPAFPLFEDRESVHEFRVPPRLITLAVTLTAKVKSLSLNQAVDVTDSHTVQLNGFATTNRIDDVHLGRFGNEYHIEFLGRIGEPMADREIHVTVKHRDFKEHVTRMLKTDAKGRVSLGELKDIEWVRANGPGGDARQWFLPTDHHSYRHVIDLKAGDVVRLPWLSSTLTRFDAALFEINAGTTVSDRFDAMKLNDGVLEIAGLAPGDFELFIKANGERIMIRVVEGSLHAGHVLGQLRHLEVSRLNPAIISGLTSEGDSVAIRIKDASPFARVHVIASRYLPVYSAYGDFAKVRAPELGGVYPGYAESVYLTGRAIGDEYRYVLDRKYAKKYVGNMLERPQLLLNPWAKRVTETGEQLAQAGGEFGGVGGAKPPRPATPPVTSSNAAIAGAVAQAATPFLDFLADESVVIANQPVKDGAVSIKKTAFGPHQFVTVVVIDPLSTTVRHLALPEQPAESLDLRLRKGLDPRAHFMQQKQVSILEAGKQFVLADAASGRFESYDSLPKLYALYSTLLKDPRMAEFAFVAKWPGLNQEEKQALYSKHACHELSFFIFKKDPDFFTKVVKPYLANKKDKTFLDLWLLEAVVDEYAKPWRYGRMNVAERVLLSQRMVGEGPKTARHLSDLFRLLPRNLDRDVMLFDTGVNGSAMDPAGAVTRGGIRFHAEEPRGTLGAMPQDAMPAPGAGANPALPPASKYAESKPKGEPRREAMEKKREEAKKELEKLDDKARDGSNLGIDKDQAGRRGGNFFQEDRAAGRKMPTQLYRRLDPTSEWAENNYHNLPIQQQLAELVSVNPFWIDYANHDAKSPFLSKNVAQACRNFTEVMLALAVTDLPFESAAPEVKFDGPQMTYTPKGRAIAFHEEVRASDAPKAGGTILVNQNFYKADDRYRDADGERSEKFVTDEFVIHTVYGCQVVVTNPTPSRQKLSVLLQIPVGAMPLAGGRNTRTVLLDLEPYRTQTLEYTFYFPAPGTFAHFPVHVSKNETLVAAAASFSFNVVAKPTKLDTESWDYVSQNGTNEQVIAFLERENVNALNLDKIAWRMKDAPFFKKVLALLQGRHLYQATLWSYSVMHNDIPSAREFLQHHDQVFAECGGPITSPLVTYDPVARYAYEHLEYKPLVNARAHSLGARRQIVNAAFHDQYHAFLKLLSYRSALNDNDKLAVVYYFLLQDRIEEAIRLFVDVKVANVQEAMQFHYCAAYLALFAEDPKAARAIAEKYAAHPVDRWRKVFAEVLSQVDEIEGKAVKLSDAESRSARQTELAAKQPSFDFTLENKALQLTWQNLEAVTVNYYLMDVELLFSRNPFVQQTGNQFAMIKPNATKEVKLAAGVKSMTIPLPDEFVKKNVFVEVVAAGKTRALPFYANAMDVKMSDAYGHLKVTGTPDGKALSKVYVKVYVRTGDGQVKFLKDGYTDLRGRFDYASVSTSERMPPQKYSVLILSDDHGAVIREVDPPQQ